MIYLFKNYFREQKYLKLENITLEKIINKHGKLVEIR